MRFLAAFFLVLSLIVAVHAWTKEDHEIFDLVSDVEKSEGKGTTFYSWLDISPSATTAEIAKAYRKKSVQLHPDKNHGLKNAHERFARLGVVAQILRSSEGRERYDFFYKNGVPKWRGTGYYYARYRPGLGSVLIFLTIITSGIQYLVQRINYRNDLARIDRFVAEARKAAWGSKMQPLDGKKKVKVNMGGRPYLDEDGNMVSGRFLDMMVHGEDVFIIEPNGDLLPLDAGAATAPALTRTWFISLLLSLYHKARPVKDVTEDEDHDLATDNREGEDAGLSGSGSGSDVPGSGSGASTPAGAGDLKARPSVVKAGGRRRVQPRKRQK